MMDHNGIEQEMRINTQIIISSTELPKDLEACRNSVVNWANSNCYELLYVDSPPYLQDYRCVTSAFDRLRVELLAERSYRLWVDWDIYLYPEFSIEDKDLVCSMDYLLWNGSNTNWFKNVLNDYTTYYKEHPNAYAERYRMWKVMKQHGIQNFKEFDPNWYRHINYSGRRKR